MASVTLENVTVDFKIYGSNKSFRKALVSRATGGGISQYDRIVTVRALENISIHLEHGDRLGLIGHNGAGKTTLLRVFAGVYEPTAGRVAVDGRLSPLFNVAPGLDFDDTGYENLITCGTYLGMSREEIRRKTPDIEQFAELGDYMNLPVRTYSTGMMVRLGFALATAIDPDILILDEGLGAGDARFADRAKQRVDALIKRSNILVLASHSDALIRSMCNRAVLLESGRVTAAGTVDEVIEAYKRLNAATDVQAKAPKAAAAE